MTGFARFHYNFVPLSIPSKWVGISTEYLKSSRNATRAMMATPMAGPPSREQSRYTVALDTFSSVAISAKAFPLRWRLATSLGRRRRVDSNHGPTDYEFGGRVRFILCCELTRDALRSALVTGSRRL